MALQITYSGSNAKLKTAVQETNKFFTGGLTELLKGRTEPFKGTKPSTLAPGKIGEFVTESSLTLTLKLYDGPDNVNGAFGCSKPTTLYYNNKKLGRQACAIASTLIHECIHALDCNLTGYEFGHSAAGRDEPGYENRAPYWIGDNAKDTLCGESLVLDTPVPLEVEWLDASRMEEFAKTVIDE
jgi:hypothetical protein